MPSHLDTKALRAVIERPEETTLWGQPRTITPRLVDRVYGDGTKLILVIPLNTRPNYYVLRGDSSWQTSRNHWNAAEHCYALDGTVDVLDWWDDFEVQDDIEEQFDSIYSERYDDPDEQDEDGFPPSFPVADFSAGWAWGWMEWPAGFEPVPLTLTQTRVPVA